jgi:hypothetical protein
MFGIPSPYLILGAVLAALGTYFAGHHYGWAERDAEMQVEIAKKNDEAREIEHVMTGKINETATKLTEANDALDQKTSALQLAIRAGSVRLPTPGCVQAAPGAPAAPGNRNEESDGSDRATLEAIAAIIAEGQRNTQQLNACIDAYNNVREQINGNR